MVTSPPARRQLVFTGRYVRCGGDDTAGARRAAHPGCPDHRRRLARRGQADPGRGDRDPVRRPAGSRDLARHAGRVLPRPGRRDHRPPRRARAARVDACQLHRWCAGRGPRRRGQLRDQAVRLRAQRAGPGGLGRGPAAAGPGDALGRDHHLPAAHRHDVYPVRQPAGLLAARGRGGASRLRAQHRLRGQGVRQPGRARRFAAPRGRTARGSGRPAGDDRQVGARLPDRGGLRARDPGGVSPRSPGAGARRARRPWPGGGLPPGPGRGPAAGPGRWSRRP